MTTDEIMALADDYAEDEAEAVVTLRLDDKTKKSRAALRAAVEQLVRERDGLRQLAKADANEQERLAVECGKLLERAERAEEMLRDFQDHDKHYLERK